MASSASTDPFYLVKDDIQASVSRPLRCAWGLQVAAHDLFALVRTDVHPPA